jgi:hypothetical protein
MWYHVAVHDASQSDSDHRGLVRRRLDQTPLPSGVAGGTWTRSGRYAYRHHTDSSGAFACPAAPVASGVNPPEERPSVTAATADRRRAQPSSTAMMAKSRTPLGCRDVRRVRERRACRRVSPFAGHDADGLRALHARDAPLNNVYRQRTAGVADGSSGDIGSYFGL